MRAINIKWDTDGDEEILKTLPKEMDIPDDIDEENVADWLSDETGFCVFGFVLETEEKKKKDQTKTLKKSRTGLTC